jgi:hypothetical protein
VHAARTPKLHIMNHDTSCQLLHLPAELRLHIYSYVVPDIPLSVSRAQYQGLLSCCRQIRSEIEPDILRAMRNMLAKITRDSLEGWNDDITFNAPQNLGELENLQGTAHICWRDLTPGVPVKRHNHPLLGLLGMHFNIVNIQATCKHKNDDEAEITPHCIWMRWIILPFASSYSSRDGLVHLNMLEFSYTDMLTCTQGGWIQPIRRYHAQKIRRARVWDFKQLENEYGEETGIRLKRR